ncbi:MAG TPA: polysaccharide biosynthesis C-terminal domain-containing protein [Thermoanaerobaculia bacterium]|nr:polysaccharide biosynthesis C-terminal domain-containing protein [Thermoanaerobaculia bacterium]
MSAVDGPRARRGSRRRPEDAGETDPGPPGILGRRIARWLELWWRIAPRGRPELRTTLTVLTGSALALVGSFVVRVLMARALEPGELGLLLLAIAIASPLAGVSSLGLSSTTALVVARRRSAGETEGARRTAASALVIAGLAGGAGVTALWLGAAPLARLFAAGEGESALRAMLRAVSPIVVSVPLANAMLGIHRGFGGATARAVLRDGGGGVARTLGVGVAALLGAGGTAIGLGFALGAALSDGTYVAYGVLRGWVARARRSFDRELLSRLRGFALLQVVGELRRWIDVLAVGLVLEPRQVGLYGLARGFGRVLEAILHAPAHSFLPTATTLDDRALRPVHGRVRQLTLALLWAPATLCLLSPAWVIVPFAGEDYREAAPLLAWLALAFLIDVLWGFNQQVLLARGGERAAMLVSLLTSVSMLLLVLFLAPRFGPAGAAAGLATVEGLRALVLSLLLRRRGYRQPGAGPVAVPALLALAAVAFPRWGGLLAPPTIAVLTVAVSTLGASALVIAVLRSSPSATNSVGDHAPADDESTRPGGR